MAWSSDSMREWLVKHKATPVELTVYDHLMLWSEERRRRSEERRHTEFQANKKPSFVVKFASRRIPLQILTVRGALKGGPYVTFYSRHYIGQPHRYDEERDPELEGAIVLQAEFWQRLIDAFGWPSLVDDLTRYENFQENCRVLGPKHTLIKSRELGTPAPEPKVLLREISDPEGLTFLLDEFVERRLEVPMA